MMRSTVEAAVVVREAENEVAGLGGLDDGDGLQIAQLSDQNDVGVCEGRRAAFLRSHVRTRAD